MILENFALLAADTARTKAYLNVMIQECILPGMCIVYSDNISKMQEDAGKYRKRDSANQYFDIDTPVLYFVQEAGIPYMLVDNKDINSEQIKNIIHGLQQKFLIYSGYGGYILKPHLFQLGKKYIHVHAGTLPRYRGSTTVYYSFLQEKTFGATAIFLSEGIDEGEVITADTFGVPEEPIDIDYIYEPYMRSKVLMKVMKKYLLDGELKACAQNTENAETYFIIHPVLKHIAMLGIEKEQNEKRI
jgi:Methionyl-tRNA formyltransferase